MNTIIVLSVTGILTLIADIFRTRRAVYILAILGVVLAAVAGYYREVISYPQMVSFNTLASTFVLVMLITIVAWLAFAGTYLREENQLTDKIALILFAAVGATIMVSFTNLAMLFLGIEILSISLYILAGTRPRSFSANEAAFKYFLMGSFATGVFLMGVALIYGSTRSFELAEIARVVSAGNLPQFFSVGLVLIFVGLAFKMSLAPFHYWAPDVYEGSPSAITAFMATVVKVAAIGAFLRLFLTGFQAAQTEWLLLVKGSIYASLILANFSALAQRNLKRMLAFSSISHVGFILMALTNLNDQTSNIILFYLASYVSSTLLGFAAVVFLENRGEAANHDTLAGLFQRSPLLASAFTIALLSMAGIPPLSGFFAKYLVINAALVAGEFWLVAVALLASLLAVYYYFANFIPMFTGKPVGNPIKLHWTEQLFIGLMMIIVLGLSLAPDFLLNLK